MNKTLLTFLSIIVLAMFCNCESPEIDDDDNSNQEVVDKGGSKGGFGGESTGGSTTNGNDSTAVNVPDSTSTGDNTGSFEEGKDMDDGDPNYGKDKEETDIRDGNDKDKGNDKGDEGESTQNDGSDENHPMSCSYFIANEVHTGVFIAGYVVGTCTKSADNAEFEPPFTYKNNLLLADKAGERDVSKIVSVKMTASQKALYNLVDHPEYYGKKIRLHGYKIPKGYLGFTGIQSYSMIVILE